MKEDLVGARRCGSGGDGRRRSRRRVGSRRGEEDVGVRDESLVFVSGENCVPGEDVEVVHVAVPVDENDSPLFRETLGEEVGYAGTAVAGPDDSDGPGGGWRHCTY